MDRYQNQRWYIKFWRRKYYILIPYRAIKFWILNRKSNDSISFETCWKISIGLAQADMKWYYEWDEVKKRIERRINGP